MIFVKRCFYGLMAAALCLCAAGPVRAGSLVRVTEFEQDGALAERVSGACIADPDAPYQSIYQARFGNARFDVRSVNVGNEGAPEWRTGLTAAFGDKSSEEFLLPCVYTIVGDPWTLSPYLIDEIRYDGAYEVTLVSNCRGVTLDLRDGSYEIVRAYPAAPMYYCGATEDGRYKVYAQLRFEMDAYNTATDVFIRDTRTGEDRFLTESDFLENISVSGDFLALTRQWRFFDIPSGREQSFTLHRLDDVATDPNQRSLAVLYDPERGIYIHLFAFCKADGYSGQTMEYPAGDRKIRAEFYDGGGSFLNRVIVDAYPQYVKWSAQAALQPPAVYCGKLVIPSESETFSGKPFIAAYDLDTGEQSRYDGEAFDAYKNILVTKKTIYHPKYNQATAFSVTKYVDDAPISTLWFPAEGLSSKEVYLPLEGPIRYNHAQDEVEFLNWDDAGPRPEPTVEFSYPFTPSGQAH